MYEKMHGQTKLQLAGLIIVETDDLLGGGRDRRLAPKFHDAVDQLKKRYNFGKWKVLMDEATEYGGRTLSQSKDFGFTISMTRYLREKAEPIHIARGRGKDGEAVYRRPDTAELATPLCLPHLRPGVGRL